ncbi:MAG: dCTP deaminase [Planctomycetota bacterium]|jgi:dCTP deaminase
MSTSITDAILVDREIRAWFGTVIRPSTGSAELLPAQVQPASLDLRLGAVLHEIRAGFLPERETVEERLEELSIRKIDLNTEGVVLQPGCVYLASLKEQFDLPDDVFARFNPRSSTGRCDLFTRVVVPGFPRFDETPRGWSGSPWLEIAPLSFPIHVRHGDRLCQARFAAGSPALTHDELLERYRVDPLCHDANGPLSEDEVRFDGKGGLELRVGLEGRNPCAWMAKRSEIPVLFSEREAHDPHEYWEAVHAIPSRSGSTHALLEPGHFYLFASRERIRIPPDLAAEMLPVDVGIGELRNNYAGFFDSGFGYHDHTPGGTPAVLEVRAHDVPFLVDDGQVLFRLQFFRTSAQPDALYGEGRASYRDQDLTLARTFRSV